MLKRAGKTAGIILLAVLAFLVCFIGFLTVTEYRPEDRQAAEFTLEAESGETINKDELFTVYTWNLGYCGLGEDSDFFMDGGEMVDPPDQDTVVQNMNGAADFLNDNSADAWLLQEVDIDSSRTGNVNQFEFFGERLGMTGAFAYNYKCPFVPIPVPPMGRVESGIATLTSADVIGEGERISLPCPFSWPVSAANLKRCLLTTRLEIEDSDKELVLVNLHLEAYDDGEGKAAQTKVLLQILEEEYEKGNYVIAGGDFNQTFPDALDKYPVIDVEKWMPGTLEADMLPEGWEFVWDDSEPTCRLLDQPYSDECQLYVIDGFIISPNVEVKMVETVDMEFKYSDHNPVKLKVSLK